MFFFFLSTHLDRVHRLRSANASEEETRKAITDRIQEELMRLRDHTHALISRATGRARDSGACSEREPPAAPERDRDL